MITHCHYHPTTLFDIKHDWIYYVIYFKHIAKVDFNYYLKIQMGLQGLKILTMKTLLKALGFENI